MKNIILIILAMIINYSLNAQTTDPHLDVEGNAKIRGKIDIMTADGDPSVFIGVNAGINDDGTDNENTFVGANAGMSNTSGCNNSFFGRSAGSNNISGCNNSFFGVSAGFDNMGFGNSFFGTRAGSNNTSGSNNSFFGRFAGSLNTSGSNNSFFGLSAGGGHNNTNSTMLGNNAKASGSLDRAIAIGHNALVDCNSCAVIGGTGADAVKVGIGTSEPTAELHVEGNAKIRGKIDIMTADGDPSVFIGVNAGINDDGTDNENTFVGANAGMSNTTGFGNSFFGRSAGTNNTSGSNNSFFGRSAGTNNTAGGGNSFFGQSSGSSHNNTRSTMLGFNAGTLDSLDRAIAIGHSALVDCHNCAVIGGTGVEAVKVGIGTTMPTSDLYIKQSDVIPSVPTTGGITLEDDDTTNKWQINANPGSLNFALNGAYKAVILNNGDYFDLDASLRDDTDQTKSSASNLKSMDYVLHKVNKLQPSTKQINRDKSNRTEWGFVAEDVAKVFPEIAPVIDGHRGIIPHYFGILSIKAIQEQQVIIEQQALQLENQQLEIANQSNTISTMKDELNVQKKQFAEMQKLLNQLIAKSEK